MCPAAQESLRGVVLGDLELVTGAILGAALGTRALHNTYPYKHELIAYSLPCIRRKGALRHGVPLVRTRGATGVNPKGREDRNPCD